MNLFDRIQKKRVVVSFEGGVVKVAYVSQAGGKAAIDKAYSFQDGEFDGFLEVSRDREFVVVCTFPTFYQGILSLPPAKEKYLPTLVEMAVRKNFVGAQEFVFFYDILEEAQQEGRKTKETFAFSVEYEQVSSIIDRFNRYGKTIVALYPSVLTLAALSQRLLPLRDGTLLAVLDTETGKTLFLLKDGRLRFVRFVQSEEPGIHAADIDNINMTVSYFRQTLRLSPSRILFLTAGGESAEETAKLVAPHVRLDEIPGVDAPVQTISQYIVPLSAALYSPELKRGNLLTPAYKSLPVQKMALTAATALLLLMTLGGFGSIALSLRDASVVKGRITALQREITEKEPLFKAYETASGDLQRTAPLVAYMNKTSSSPDVKKALAALSFLPMDHVTTESIQLEAKEDGLAIAVRGSIQADTFADMDARYRGLITRLRAIRGIQVGTDQIDPKDMTFTIEAKWKI
jgi:hypothetical protein